jgi:GT2 family glycosyltransferase
MADVRVGIVSWNTAALLERCLQSLPAALGGLDAEVVVVDNASSDGSADVAACHPGVRVVRMSSNVGYARAMNVALAGTEAPVLAAVNPDTELPPDSLAILAGRVRQPGVGLVVPQLTNSDGTMQRSVYRFPSLRVTALAQLLPRWSDPAPTRPGPVDWAIGAVHVMNTAALGGQPPYSERWFMYTEDIELCWRLQERGWSVRLEPDVQVLHVGNASGAQAWGTARDERYMRGVYDFDARTRGRIHARALAAVLVVGTIWRWLINRLRRGGPGNLRRVLSVHVQTLFHGPPAPERSGPGERGAAA